MTNYKSIGDHYENCLTIHGDTHKGVDWPRIEDLETRYQVMLDVCDVKLQEPMKLLDFGCGTSELYAYIQKNNLLHIEYSGLDISKKFIDVSKEKFPENRYYCMDILESASGLPEFDCIVLNGVFTQKRDLSFEDMFDFLKRVLLALRPHFRYGLSFNVMSNDVDFKKEASFHLPFETLSSFLVSNFGRNFTFRHDYGLYEYTCYLYHEPANVRRLRALK